MDARALTDYVNLGAGGPHRNDIGISGVHRCPNGVEKRKWSNILVEK